MLPDAEGLSNCQAADAVRRWIDGTDALGLECTDPGCDRTSLSEFRPRFVRGQAAEQGFEALVARGRDPPWRKAHRRQRTDSTPGLGAIRAMNRGV
jgi:hypothetical protein